MGMKNIGLQKKLNYMLMPCFLHGLLLNVPFDIFFQAILI